MHPSMLRQGRGEGRGGRPNGRAYNDYPPDQDHADPLDPPYYVQDLNKHRSLDDVKKMPEDYRAGGPNEPLYHQPPTALETQDRYHGPCAPGEVPGLVPTGANSLTSPYFAQHQLRMGQGGGRRFSPLRLPLGASDSSWRRCSWRCTAVIFVCVTLCLAATTTFLATSQVGGWQTSESCQDDVVRVEQGLDSAPSLNLPPPRQTSSSTGKSSPSYAPAGTPWAAPFVSSLSSMVVGVAPSRAYARARLRGMNFAHVISAPNIPPLPAVSQRIRGSSSSSSSSSRSSSALSAWYPRNAADPAAVAAVAAASAAATFHGAQQYMSSPDKLDDMHAVSLLFPLVDVYQYPTGSRRKTVLTSGHVDSTRLPLDVTQVSSVASSQRVPESTGNKLSALDTRSSGIDLGVGWEEEEEEEEEEGKEEEENEQQQQQHQKPQQQHLGFPFLATLQEKLILLNQDNGVADNRQEIRETFAAHNPTNKIRRKRSALSLHSPNDDDKVLFSTPESPTIASHPSHLSPSPTLPHFSSSLSSTILPELSSHVYNSPFTTLPSEVTSTNLMNKQVTLETSTTLREEDASHTADAHLTQIIATRSPDTAVAMSISTAETIANAKTPVVTINHSQARDNAEINIIPEESQSGDETVYSSGSLLLDITDSPFSEDVQRDSSSRERETISRTLDKPSLLNAAALQKREENLSLGNASVHDYEYQVSPETSPTPVVLPSFQDSVATQSLESGTISNHAHSTLALSPDDYITHIKASELIPPSLTGTYNSPSLESKQIPPVDMASQGTVTKTVMNINDAIIIPNEKTNPYSEANKSNQNAADFHTTTATDLVLQQNPTPEQAIFTSPLPDESIKRDHSGVNNPNMTTTGGDIHPNQNEGNVMREPQVMLTSNNKIHQGQEGISGIGRGEGWQKEIEEVLRDMEEDLDMEEEIRRAREGHFDMADEEMVSSEGRDVEESSTVLTEGNLGKDLDDVENESENDGEIEKEETFLKSHLNGQPEHQDGLSVSHQDYGIDPQDYDQEFFSRDGENIESDVEEVLEKPIDYLNDDSVIDYDDDSPTEHNQTEDSFSQMPEFSALRVVSSDSSFHATTLGDMKELNEVTDNIIHYEKSENKFQQKESGKELSHHSQEDLNSPHHDNSSSIQNHPQETIFNAASNDSLTTAPSVSMTSSVTPTLDPALDVEDEQYITSSSQPNVEQITFPTQLPDPQSFPSPDHSRGEQFFETTQGKPLGLPREEGQSLMSSTSQGEYESEDEVARNTNGENLFISSDTDYISDTMANNDSAMSSFDDKEMHTDYQQSERINNDHLSSLSRDSESQWSHSEEEKNDENNREEAIESRELEATLPTPSSDISISSAPRESNENSYVVTRDSLDAPVIEDVPLNANLALDREEQMDDGSAVHDVIAINEVTPKYLIDKTIINDPAHPISHSQEDDAKSDDFFSSPISSPPPPPSSWADNPADVILGDGDGRQETIEISSAKQSVSGSVQAPAGSGYGERKEFVFDTGGSEANSDHSFLSTSYPAVGDSSQEESIQSQVGNDEGPVAEYQDHDISSPIVHQEEGRIERKGMSEVNEYEENEPFEYEEGHVKDYSSYEETGDYENDEVTNESAGHQREEMKSNENEHSAASALDNRDSHGSPTYNNHLNEVAMDLETGKAATSEEGKNCIERDPNGHSSKETITNGHINVSDPNIMLHRERWESQDPTCKCSCQCDGSENPPIMPGRVAANLNSRDPGGDRHNDPPSASSTTTSTTSTTPLPIYDDDYLLPPTHSPHHRHRHHHGDFAESTTMSTTPETTEAPTTFIETIWLPSVNPHRVLYPDGEADEHEDMPSVTTPSYFNPEDIGYDADNDGLGSISAIRPHQVAPPDGSSFSALQIGEEASFKLAPYGYWNLHLTLTDPTDIRIVLTIPRGTSLGLYARRSALPTHTQHDIMRILRGTRQRDIRASPNVVEIAVEEVLEAGEWFLSLYNDDGDPHQVALVISRGPGVGECPQRCNDRGDCILGRCQCRAGYSGVDCSQMLCPILCSGHGEYVAGQCKCHMGFKGKECQLRHHECEVTDCNGHGHCLEGRCHCAKGYTGEFCEIVDCPHPTCTGHGWCVGGTCVCQKGWQGSDCSEMDMDALQCLPDCNGHGAFSVENHACVCDLPWTGSDCSKKACSLECGPHGSCENDACHCHSGWTGPTCSERLCDARCSEHGQCKNGTCVCMTGWNGRHCTLSGCPGNCRNRGTCQADSEGIWKCSCETGWDGADCSVMLETQCNDHIDNDRDGLLDCEDPECCTHHACNGSVLCVSRAPPIDILLRKQPPGATASFFEKMRFLIEEDSLQLFTNGDNFNQRRAAVVRGRVVTKAGRGVVGLRVSTSHNREGFTLTRKDGWFDIMVNGGGAVTLSFGKPPFSPKQIRVMVPWNEVVVLDDIIMTVSGLSGPDHLDTYHDHPQRLLSSQCPDHDYDLLRPVVMATWQNSFQGKCPDTDAILVESQAVQESVLIPGTGLYLVYHSSRSDGYESTLRLQLTPDRIPSSLRRVHLRIVLEGILFTKIFEADPAIKFTYAWNRMNVYRQRVYGVTVARVSVGYEHVSCQHIIWEHQTARIAGYDLKISMVGGFNLHVHHAYNIHQGILQKGDGQNIHLAGQRHLVTTLLGTGEQREVDCGDRCEGMANQSPVLAPTCLAAAPDGSLYVGDFNLIRRVKPDGTVVTVARLNETRVSYRYHVAVSPLDGSVYVSDPEAHQVLKLESTDNVKDPLHNTIAVVGSGQRCLPGDNTNCGDGDIAIHARLTYPKGLAVSSAGDIYIADGTNIRVVSPAGFIHTVIGGHDHRSHWAPVPCNGTINMDQLHLRWPTELAISPLDGSLHILDDHLVLRVTPDSRVQVLTGRSLNCPTPAHESPDVSRTALLLNPQSIAFSPQGELYVGESDTQRINRVRVITSDGRITTFAGADSRCNCRDPACYCHAYDNVSAASAKFSSISSIAVTPDGVLHIADQAGYRVRSVKSLLPELNERKEYEIYSPDTHEVYVFDRFGQHSSTRNLVTGQTIYKFKYTIGSVGKLLDITDAASNTIQFIRNHFGEVTALVNPQKQRVMISLNMDRLLEQMVAPDGYNITFRYHGNHGLMRSKIEALGRTYSYEYDDQGRLTQAVLPTGQVIHLDFDLSVRGAEITVTRDGKDPVVTRVRGNALSHDSGFVESITALDGDGQLKLVTNWEHEVSLEQTAYRVLEESSPTAAEMFPVLARQQTHISNDIVNRYEWNYSPPDVDEDRRNKKVSATLRVNGADLLTLSYDRASSSEALLSVSGQMLVNITYDAVGRPVHWVPVSPLVPVNVTYDHWGHITSWLRGNHSEAYIYDTYLRLISVTYADGTKVTYDYRDKLTKPEKVTHPSGRAYGLVYDDAGSLRQVVTPRGSAYTLHLTTSLGFYRLILALPVDSIALQMRLDERGRLLSVSLPGRGGTLLYQYNDMGEISTELYGHGYTEYSYHETGLVKTARTKHNHNDIRTDYRYHGGLMKEMRVRYGPKSDLHNVKLKFQYDVSARLRKLEGDINSSALKEVYIRFDNQTGVLQLISDLRIIRNNILETMLQNPKKHFVNTRKQDNYGRLSQVDMTLQGRTVYLMQLKYDNRNRISERLIEVAGRREGLNITYMADGQILEARGTHTWFYSYDANGNIISHTEKGYAESLEFDECDRVVSVGTTQVEYDERGYVIRFDNQNFEYNTKGQLVSAWDSGESWSFTLGYDHHGRVSVYRDHLNNATQIIYGRPDLPDLITHLHNPHSGTTASLLYDDMNHLIAVDQDDGRYFVTTDQNGTPIAIFDDMGALIRSQVWSPFGQLVDYAGNNMWVGVGPWGGFLEPETGIVIIKGHAYHPKLLQWMTPRWEHLTLTTRHVTDVFVYRFMNNNPFNLPSGLQKHYYTDVSDWLELYGIELDRVLGSEYHESTMVRPKPMISVENLGASEVVSGLFCQYRAGVKHLHDLSFYSQSNIQRSMGTWNGAPISRQASIFGPGVLVSNINGRVLVTAITEDDFSGVIGDVIRTVLNNSIILDVSATHSGLDTFYFIKDSRDRAGEDIQHLRRLSGIFNVTTSETERGHEISMSTPTAHLVIMYGERVQRARRRILKELEDRAEAIAWEREASLVLGGRPGSHTWSAVEAAQLVREGRVPGYVASHIHSTAVYPLLASDASNIIFKHETARKRRGSRRKSRKKSWRQRKKGARSKNNT